MLEKEELQSKIIELRKSGKSYLEIKKELNCTLLTIQKACNRNGAIITHPTKISEEKKKEIIDVYNQTKSMLKTSKIVGCSKSTVGKYVNNSNYYEKNAKSKIQSVISWRQRTKLKLIEYKGGSCTKCGYNKCPGALTFHHLDPTEKDFRISGQSWSFERLKEEADKCILLCANCHHELHAGIN